MPEQTTTTFSRSPALASPAGRAVRVQTSRVFNWLLVAYGLLLAAHLAIVAGLLSGHRPGRVFFEKFYFDREANFPSFFSSLILLAAAALLAIIANLKRADRDAFRGHWLGLSGIFLLLAVDETVSLHESLIEPLREALHLSGYLYFSWVLAGGALVLVFGLVYARFLRHLSPAMRWRFILAGAVYVGGAVGLEAAGGRYYTPGSSDLASYFQTPTYLALMTLEESLEMAGILLFIGTLLTYLRAYAQRLLISVG